MIAGGSGGFHSNLLKDLVQVDLVGFDVLHDPKNTEKERVGNVESRCFSGRNVPVKWNKTHLGTALLLLPFACGLRRGGLLSGRLFRGGLLWGSLLLRCSRLGRGLSRGSLGRHCMTCVVCRV